MKVLSIAEHCVSQKGFVYCIVLIFRWNIVVPFISESPGPPSDVRVSNVTNTSAVLSWSPPVNDGGRPLSEIFYTITAAGECPSL